MLRQLLLLSALSPVAARASPRAAVLRGSVTATDVADAITELGRGARPHSAGGCRRRFCAPALERAALPSTWAIATPPSATLATLTGVKEAAPLAALAKNCARATAGSLVVEDTARGLWIRLQDDADRALLPLLSEVAANARAAIERDLGVVMPRPLRIDLVRDHFSLSALSGLPLQAAETTGTVAVARWGRVNMISPRAAPGGFPWEDTLAHEITHLADSRGRRATAPVGSRKGLPEAGDRLATALRSLRRRAACGRRGEERPPHGAIRRRGQARSVDRHAPECGRRLHRFLGGVELRRILDSRERPRRSPSSVP